MGEFSSVQLSYVALHALLKTL